MAIRIVRYCVVPLYASGVVVSVMNLRLSWLCFGQIFAPDAAWCLAYVVFLFPHLTWRGWQRWLLIMAYAGAAYMAIYTYVRSYVPNLEWLDWVDLFHYRSYMLWEILYGVVLPLLHMCLVAADTWARNRQGEAAESKERAALSETRDANGR